MGQSFKGDTTDPAFDTPPAFAEAQERRMHVRAYDHWSGLLGGRAFPTVADLHPASLDDFGPHSVLLDFTADAAQPRLRFVGQQLRQECGLDGYDLGVGDVPSRSLISRLTDHFLEILANRAPVGFEAEFVSQRGAQTLYRGILMPLSSDGRAIDYIFGVINWKELASVDLTLAIERELASVATAESSEAGLMQRLAVARRAAGAFEQADCRSRAALYRALAEVYELHLAATIDPGGFSRLMAASGLRTQERAPMTPLVKLVFGKGLDKARVTEFAAALAVAARAGVRSGGFEAFIEVAGGLKTLVTAERLARRTATGRAIVSATSEVRSRLRTAPGLASVAIPNDGGEFVLLLARREANGTLLVLESVPDAENLLENVLRKLGSAPCRELSQAA